jgi:hypothetical protein
MIELPVINFKGHVLTYDYRLSQLREVTERGMRFINLNVQENELLDYAIKMRCRGLINANLKDLEWKI